MMKIECQRTVAFFYCGHVAKSWSHHFKDWCHLLLLSACCKKLEPPLQKIDAEEVQEQQHRKRNSHHHKTIKISTSRPTFFEESQWLKRQMNLSAQTIQVSLILSISVIIPYFLTGLWIACKDVSGEWHQFDLRNKGKSVDSMKPPRSWGHYRHHIRSEQGCSMVFVSVNFSFLLRSISWLVRRTSNWTLHRMSSQWRCLMGSFQTCRLDFGSVGIFPSPVLVDDGALPIAHSFPLQACPQTSSRPNRLRALFVQLGRHSFGVRVHGINVLDVHHLRRAHKHILVCSHHGIFGTRFLHWALWLLRELVLGRPLSLDPSYEERVQLRRVGHSWSNLRYLRWRVGLPECWNF